MVRGFFFAKKFMSIETNNTTPYVMARLREEFEVWYCKRYAIPYSIDRLRVDNHYGHYRILLNALWEGWQGKAGLL